MSFPGGDRSSRFFVSADKIEMVRMRARESILQRLGRGEEQEMGNQEGQRALKDERRCDQRFVVCCLSGLRT
jgi:hypothetical protein